MRLELLRRQRFGNSYHREFGRTVGAETEGKKPRHGGGVDDVAALAVALEQRQERLHAMHDAHQIDVDRPAPILQRNIVRSLRAQTAFQAAGELIGIPVCA